VLLTRGNDHPFWKDVARLQIPRHVLLALTPLIAAFQGCIFDADDRCGEGQVIYGDDVRCVCAEGATWTEEGCVPCGENEVPDATGCTCESGFVRPTPDAACEPVPGLGDDCDTESVPCTEPDYPYCQVVSGTAGYCTASDCTTSSDCPAGYACETSGSPRFCKRPPVGAGESCESSADCAGTEATFCETFTTHQCLVEGCSLAPDDCFEGNTCCDLSQFGLPTVCVPEGTCPS
jgi:hypothetical protein